MTAEAVVDASAIVAMLFNEPPRDKVAARLRDRALYAPELLPFEVANACLKKIRVRPAESNELLAAFSTLYRLPIVLAQIDARETIELAFGNKLSLYDASYLWLARDMGAELVTLDGALEAAAKIS